MRVTFVAMGWENISIEYLSASLKNAGHTCFIAYDQSLFDDKNYVSIKPLATFFKDSSCIVEQILKSRPDIIAFSVMTVMYDWCLNLSQVLKTYLDVPIIFGGYHPTTAPEVVIREKVVDMICVGEGDIPLLELCNSYIDGKFKKNIPGIWYKSEDGNIISLGASKPIEDLNNIPYPDKELLEKHVPMSNYLLYSLARGCIYNCHYCSVTTSNNIAREAGIKAFRIVSPKRAIEELKYFKTKYNYKWIDFRHAIFAFDPKWIIEFCETYKKEINVPFRIFFHPSLVTDEVVKSLVDAKCFTIQIGLESFDEGLRKEALNRQESNEQIHKAIAILEKNKAHYTLDYILGLPGQKEEELQLVAELFSRSKYCYRLSPFMCQYLPGSKLIDYGLKIGELTKKDVAEINQGNHGNYMGEGSIEVYSIEKQRMLRMYRVLFRTMGLLPSYIRIPLVKSKVYKLFSKLNPIFANIIIKFLDIFILILNRDARGYFINYLWWIQKRFQPSHPYFIFRKTRIKEIRNLNFHTPRTLFRKEFHHE
ncbi:MAG: B12-binding domain-containing radical SAM protein [Oligoflexia bacterium]|nr:B12-binding domain-containing radical SAM protein [Oligoflexia bacterium]